MGRFHPESLKTERLVSVETNRRTDGQTDMSISTRLVMLIKNIYTLWGRNKKELPFQDVLANFLKEIIKAEYSCAWDGPKHMSWTVTQLKKRGR